MEGFQSLGCIVAAVHPLEMVIVEALDSHTHPVHSQTFEKGGEIRSDVIWVQFHGEFLKALQIEIASQGIANTFQHLRFQHGRSASAEVQGVYCSAIWSGIMKCVMHRTVTGSSMTGSFIEKIALLVDFPANGVNKIIPQGKPPHGIKVAISAEFSAKRNMNVNSCHCF